MESRHSFGGIFFCPVHNALTSCSLQAFGIRCILTTALNKVLKSTMYREICFFQNNVVCMPFSTYFLSATKNNDDLPVTCKYIYKLIVRLSLASPMKNIKPP